MLPREEFGRHSGSADGLQAYCRPCKRVVSAAWRAKRPGYFADWRADSKLALQAYEQARAERRKGPEHAARMALNQAVRNGIVIREPCLFCGDDLVEAHHHDYSLPLSVTWLCLSHHHQIHADRKAITT